MSRSRKAKRRGGAAAPAGGGTPRRDRARSPQSSGGGRARSGRGILILAVLAAALSLWLWKGRARPPAAPPELTTGALADSLDHALISRNWASAIDFSQRLARLQPQRSDLIRTQAMVLHNEAVDQTSQAGRPHPPLRTSLERIETMQRVFALLDSAAALARTPDDWAQARQWYGHGHEELGFPLDAHEIYTEIRARNPGYAPARARLEWVKRLLRNPISGGAEP